METPSDTQVIMIYLRRINLDFTKESTITNPLKSMRRANVMNIWIYG